MKNVNQEIYDTSFYARISDWSLKSARVIVPIMIEIAKPTSVVDVGCGDCTWLQVFRDIGVVDVLGIDGDYVSKEILKIPVEEFVAWDLNIPVQIDRKFDIAICFEVGEHLPESSAETLVNSLVNLSDVVFFSAAIPFQNGENHINTQWQSYWANLFEKDGYLPITTIRQSIWNEPGIPFFYKQNITLFVKKDHLFLAQKLKTLYEQSKANPMSVVHPDLYLNLIKSLVKAREELPFITLVFRRVKRRIGMFSSFFRSRFNFKPSSK